MSNVEARDELDYGRGRARRASPARRRWVLVAASVASFMVALDLLVVTTALDTIRRDLDRRATALQWTVTAYSVSFAALLLTGARSVTASAVDG